MPVLRGCGRRSELGQRTGPSPAKDRLCVSAHSSAQASARRRGSWGAPREKTRSRGWAWGAKRTNRAGREGGGSSPPGPQLPVFSPLPARHIQKMWSLWMIFRKAINLVSVTDWSSVNWLEPNFSMMMGPGDREACGSEEEEEGKERNLLWIKFFYSFLYFLPSFSPGVHCPSEWYHLYLPPVFIRVLLVLPNPTVRWKESVESGWCSTSIYQETCAGC